MTTLAFLEGIGSPLHWLVLLVLFGGTVITVGVVILATRSATQAHPMPPVDHDLQRRRMAADVERLELDNEERRRRLAQTPPPVPPAR